MNTVNFGLVVALVVVGVLLMSLSGYTLFKCLARRSSNDCSSETTVEKCEDVDNLQRYSLDGATNKEKASSTKEEAVGDMEEKQRWKGMWDVCGIKVDQPDPADDDSAEWSSRRVFQEQSNIRGNTFPNLSQSSPSLMMSYVGHLHGQANRMARQNQGPNTSSTVAGIYQVPYIGTYRYPQFISGFEPTSGWNGTNHEDFTICKTESSNCCAKNDGSFRRLQLAEVYGNPVSPSESSTFSQPTDEQESFKSSPRDLQTFVNLTGVNRHQLLAGLSSTLSCPDVFWTPYAWQLPVFAITAHNIWPLSCRKAVASTPTTARRGDQSISVSMYPLVGSSETSDASPSNNLASSRSTSSSNHAEPTSIPHQQLESSEEQTAEQSADQAPNVMEKQPSMPATSKHSIVIPNTVPPKFSSNSDVVMTHVQIGIASTWNGNHRGEASDIPCDGQVTDNRQVCPWPVLFNTHYWV